MPGAIGLLLPLLAAVAAPSAGHDMWLRPSSFAPAAGELVEVRLLIGHAGSPEPVRRHDHRLLRFAAVGPAGEAPLAGLDGSDPAGYLRPPAPGLYALVLASKHAFSELPAERFTAYLEEEGLQAVVRARAERGAAGAPGRERYARSLKSLLAVGGVGGRDGPRGLPLELVLETPLPAPGDAAVTLQLLLRGAPLAGALVDLRPLDAVSLDAVSLDAVSLDAVSLDAVSPVIARRTGADGRIALTPGAGRWLAAAVHMEAAAPADDGAAWQSIFTTLTFTLGLTAEAAR